MNTPTISTEEFSLAEVKDELIIRNIYESNLSIIDMRVVIEGIINMILTGAPGGTSFPELSKDAMIQESNKSMENAGKILNKMPGSSTDAGRTLLTCARLHRANQVLQTEIIQMMYTIMRQRLQTFYSISYPVILPVSTPWVEEEDVLSLLASDTEEAFTQASPKKEELADDHETAEDKVCFRCYQPSHKMFECTNKRVRRPRATKRKRPFSQQSTKGEDAQGSTPRKRMCH